MPTTPLTPETPIACSCGQPAEWLHLNLCQTCWEAYCASEFWKIVPEESDEEFLDRMNNKATSDLLDSLLSE